jgi:hypothetical protein
MKIKGILLAAVFVTACISQQSVEDVKNLALIYPPLGQDPTSMITGVRNIEQLPVGTHIVTAVTVEGTVHEVPTRRDTVMDVTVSGRDIMDGIHCIVLDFTMDMKIKEQGETMVITSSGTEWIDEDGIPVKLKEDMTMIFDSFTIPLSIEVTRDRKEVYKGHDCWVFSGVQTTTVMGNAVEDSILMYLDRKSAFVVWVLTEIGDEPVDTGYMEPPTPVDALHWELGDKESITTPMGVYECQSIYLRENGTGGTIWVHKDFNIPVQYVYTIKTEDMDLLVTIVLVAYT